MLRILNFSELVMKRIIQAMVTVLFLVMSSLIVAQVFTRFCTASSLTWSEELSRFVMIWLIYLASVLAYADNAHIAVDALIGQLKGRFGVAVKILNRVFVVLFACLIVWGAIEFMPTTAMQEAPATGLIMSWIYIIVPFSLFFTGLTAIKQIFQLATGVENSDTTPWEG